jgi:hypothetical protein
MGKATSPGETLYRICRRKVSPFTHRPWLPATHLLAFATSISNRFTLLQGSTSWHGQDRFSACGRFYVPQSP